MILNCGLIFQKKNGKNFKLKNMKPNRVIFNVDTFGITNKSLKMLRNTIAESVNHEIVVVEIPTNDICCGFLVLNKTIGTATWSGDGFRHDRGGEGGRGYAKAHIMLEMFGVKTLNIFSQSTSNMFGSLLNGPYEEEELSKRLLQACERVTKEFDESEYLRPCETTPWY